MSIPNTFVLFIFAAALFSETSRAGTLDNAPFEVVLPKGNAWKINDSIEKYSESGLGLLATIVNADDQMLGTVASSTESTDSFDELLKEFRESLTSLPLKNVTEADTTFVGCKAKRFMGEGTVPGMGGYAEIVLFAVEGKCWIITIGGPMEHKKKIREAFSIFQKRIEGAASSSAGIDPLGVPLHKRKDRETGSLLGSLCK